MLMARLGLWKGDSWHPKAMVAMVRGRLSITEKMALEMLASATRQRRAPPQTLLTGVRMEQIARTVVHASFAQTARRSARRSLQP
jgi:hypothetical protein